ncbi:uncharacterized protein LOC141832672 [Curcuma longa]|uniref:uncharacterized protein LOC141832672 n=1 Tax=Curcuma longa TaxID=136217 RepID=UPI003D9F5FAE
MPQLGLAGGDARVGCEPEKSLPPADHPDLPPDSIVVPVGDFEWDDLGAPVVYERDDSTKGSTNPKAQAQQRQHGNLKPSSTSKRFSGNHQPKPPIIGLPGPAKIQCQSGPLGQSSRRSTVAPFFPNKPPGERDRRSSVPGEEPGSPKVSCFGKVRPERERERRHRQSSDSAGCWSSAGATVSFCQEDPDGGGGMEAAAVKKAEAVMEPPQLAAMNRFSSRRRQLDFAAVVPEGEEERVQPLDREAAEWAPRRSLGSLPRTWPMGETVGLVSDRMFDFDHVRVGID